MYCTYTVAAAAGKVAGVSLCNCFFFVRVPPLNQSINQSVNAFFLQALKSPFCSRALQSKIVY